MKVYGSTRRSQKASVLAVALGFLFLVGTTQLAEAADGISSTDKFQNYDKGKWAMTSAPSFAPSPSPSEPPTNRPTVSSAPTQPPSKFNAM